MPSVPSRSVLLIVAAGALVTKDIPAGKLAPAVLLAALSLAVGLINAACMTY